MEDLTLLVTLNRSDENTLRWVRALSADKGMSGYPIIIIYDESKSHLVPQVNALLQPIRTVEIAKPHPTTPSRAFLEVLRTVKTKYVAVLDIPGGPRSGIKTFKRYLKRWRKQTVGLELELKPLLVPMPQRQRAWFRAYLHEYSLAISASPSYFAMLADHVASFSLESIDVREGGEIELQARYTLGQFNLVHEMPSRMDLVVVDHRGKILASAPAHVSQRVDSYGKRRWENLTARMNVSKIPDGNHQIRIALNAELRLFRDLVPTPGLLSSARTRVARTERTATALLVHTIDTGTRSWLTVRRGEPSKLPSLWQRELVRKDLRSALQDRSAKNLRFSRLLRLLTLPLYRKREIWIIGEREDTAQDNGMHLFRFLRTVHPNRNAFYVIDRNSAHWDRISGLGNVLAHSSFRHRLLMLHATVLANAYSIKHMVPRQWDTAIYTRFLAWRVGALRAYLKHGVHHSTNAVKRGDSGYDLYLTVNSQETSALREESGYNTQLRETGLPRYDALYPTEPSRTILFMPTWRRYLVPKLFGNSTEAQVPFRGSKYEQFLTGFLKSPRLHELLESYDYTLQFLPHYNMSQILSDYSFEHPRIKFIDAAETAFSELLTDCDVFITDYSSVHFDVAYVGTPVIYAQFDQEEALTQHLTLSWFDYGRDGFGPVTTNIDETLDALENALEQDCAFDPSYAARLERAFTHRDHNNAARVTAELDDIVNIYRRELGRSPDDSRR